MNVFISINRCNIDRSQICNKESKSKSKIGQMEAYGQSHQDGKCFEHPVTSTSLSSARCGWMKSDIASQI